MINTKNTVTIKAHNSIGITHCHTRDVKVTFKRSKANGYKLIKQVLRG